VLATLDDLRGSSEHIVQIIAHVPPLVARLIGRLITAEMTPAYARLCLPFLGALMLRNGRIDPRRFNPETFADPVILAIADQIWIAVDANPDPNALSPQKLELLYADGSHVYVAIPHTLGSPDAPMDAEQSAAKYALCEVLAVHVDPALFHDPLTYFCEPERL
jgi:2-methylcitrate dehydratase PrpD